MRSLRGWTVSVVGREEVIIKDGDNMIIAKFCISDFSCSWSSQQLIMRLRLVLTVGGSSNWTLSTSWQSMCRPGGELEERVEPRKVGGVRAYGLPAACPAIEF